MPDPPPLILEVIPDEIPEDIPDDVPDYYDEATFPLSFSYLILTSIFFTIILVIPIVNFHFNKLIKAAKHSL